MRTLLLSILFLGIGYYSQSQYLVNNTYIPSQSVNGPTKIIESTNQDGVLVIANWVSSGVQTGHIMKLNQVGDTVWRRDINGLELIELEYESASSYLILGNNGNTVLLSIDDAGNVLWSTEYEVGSGNAMSKSSMGEIFIISNNNTVSKLNSTGDTIWVREYFDSIPNPWMINYQGFFIYKVEAASDGGCVIMGSHEDQGSADTRHFFFKLDSIGTIEWTREFSSMVSWPMGGYHHIQSLDETSMGYLVSVDQGPGKDGRLIQFDFMGNILWAKRFSLGFGANDIFAFPISGNNIMLGITADGSILPYSYLQLLKINSNGDTLWTNSVYGIGSGFAITDRLDGFEKLNGDFVFVGQGVNNWLDRMYVIEMESSGLSYCNNIVTDVNINNFNPSYLYDVPIDMTFVPSFQISNYNPVIDVDSFDIVINCLQPQEVCVVSVDQDSVKNVIIWEKQYDSTFVDYYNVYKETTVANVFNVIGSVPSTQDGYFMDMTSNPNQVAARYYVTPVHIIGPEGDPGTIHKTILLQISAGVGNDVNLSWNHYEGLSFGTYRIWRGNNTSGYQLIDSVANTLNSYTDINPPATDSIYYIEIALPQACDPAAKAAVGSTKSNLSSLNSSGISELNLMDGITIYPNPTDGQFSILGLGNQSGILSISSIDGSLFLSKKSFKQGDTFELRQAGVYLITIEYEHGIIGTYRLVVQ